MVDGLCLINFNARVYDPSLGRFMSADPVVGDETILQQLNRYSYVLNDPLSLTDPSGMCGFWCIFDDILAIVVAVVIEQPEVSAWINGSIGLTGINAALFGPAIDAGIAGGISGFIATGGSLKGAALGLLEAGLFDFAGGYLQDAGKAGFLGIGHVPSEFIAHGVVGGLVSEIGSGNFESGFLAGGISSLAPVPAGKQSWEKTLEGSIESAALGGLGSVLGGEKFENGAITGAFAYLFNDAAHSWGAAGAAGGAVVGGVAVSGACDVATEGVCAAATPATVAAGSAAGAAIGGAVGTAAGTVVDEVVVTAQRVNANSGSSMIGTELYYLINRTSGAIDKIGVTSYPGERYFKALLDSDNVDYGPVYFFQWRYAAYVAENIDRMAYYAIHLKFPPLNCCSR
jgi:RHS repeat-associated protein